MPTQQSRHIAVTIAVPFDRAYGFAKAPASFARWAAGLAETLHETPGGWVAATPGGEAEVRFAEPNAYGVLDHRVRLPGRPEIVIPLRMIANGDGTEVVLTLYRQPGMTDADFAADGAAVERDLAALKALLEHESRP